MTQRLRIFISSPADVPDERLRADLIVDKLSLDFGRFFAIESYRWEHEALLASGHFQDAIEPPSSFDIVVLILWSRLGTLLPEKTAEREYRGIDGRAPVTGTEWEYEEALKVAREKKAPDLLAFRNISPAPIDPRDSDAQAQSMAQLAALNAFWTRHFADRGVFLAAYDEYRTLEEFAQRLEASLRKLIERRVKDASAGESRTDPIWLGDPFRGLESYEFEHAPIFFGRDAVVTKAAEQFAGNARSGHAFLLVSGASGSGKSSLVKAGVVPRLTKPQRMSGLAFLRRVVLRPGSEDADVFVGLAKALTRAGGSDVGLAELIAPGQHAGQLAAHLRGAGADPGYLFANALGRLTEAGRRSGRLLAFEDAKLILVVDQLEELFTTAGIGAEDRREFVRLVASLARSGAVWVVATLRADFWHRAAEIPELVALAEGPGRIDVAAPSPAELAEMIRKPAQAAGLSFEAHAEKGLGLDAVLAEHAAAAPGALPLLSFTLDELYKNAKARGSTVLTHESYQALGGLEGAIAKRADEIVAALPADAHAALPRVLRALTTVSGANDQTPVARSAPLASFPEGRPDRALIDAFIAARLLVAASEGGAAATVRLAHEALISGWQRARDQLAADGRDLATRMLLERQFDRWDQARGGTRRLMLLRNPDLANAINLAKRWGDELDAPLGEFINRSTRRARLSQTLTAAAAVLFALIACGALYAARQAVTQTYQARVHQIGLLAELANGEGLRGNWDTALRLGSEVAERAFALDPYGSVASASRSALARTVWQVPWRLGVATDSVLCAVFSPDGRRIVTAAQEKVEIWDAVSGKKITELEGESGFSSMSDTVTSVAFSPDGKLIVAASENSLAAVWNVATGKQIQVLRGHEGWVNSAAFSPDGSRIVTASVDMTARVWDAATGKQNLVLTGHTSPVTAAAFSPDGERIVTGSYDAVRVWDAATGKQILVLNGNPGVVYSAAFSPDGKRIVTAGFGAAVRIWNAATGEPIAQLLGHQGDIKSVAFSPDGSRLVTASLDHTARIWNVQNGNQIAVLRGHSEAVRVATFSPDGKEVLTASLDGTVRLWNTGPEQPVVTLSGHDAELTFAAYSPDGSRIVTASVDKTARVWDVRTQKNLLVLRGHEGWLNSAAFSPDGQRIVTASSDNTARIWDAATGTEIAVLSGHAEGVNSAVFSPDGKHIVTASDDGTARLWDTATARQIGIFRLIEVKVFSAAFSPDGKRIVTASGRNQDDSDPQSPEDDARIWDVATGDQVVELPGRDFSVSSAVFSPDGKRIVTASADHAAHIWDAATGKEIAVLLGHESPVRFASFSPDGSRVVTASLDGTIRFWDAANGREIAVLRESKRPVNSAAFSPDGRDVAVAASDDKIARVWDVRAATMSTEDLVSEVCTRLLRGWTGLNRDEMRLADYPDSTENVLYCPGAD